MRTNRWLMLILISLTSTSVAYAWGLKEDKALNIDATAHTLTGSMATVRATGGTGTTSGLAKLSCKLDAALSGTLVTCYGKSQDGSKSFQCTSKQPWIVAALSTVSDGSMLLITIGDPNDNNPDNDNECVAVTIENSSSYGPKP
jgi:hypothetical protein